MAQNIVVNTSRAFKLLLNKRHNIWIVKWDILDLSFTYLQTNIFPLKHSPHVHPSLPNIHPSLPSYWIPSHTHSKISYTPTQSLGYLQRLLNVSPLKDSNFHKIKKRRQLQEIVVENSVIHSSNSFT